MSVPEALRRPLPWRVGDLLLLYATTTTGCVLVLASWFAVAGEVRLNDQVPWLNAGVAGVIVLGAGNLAWLLAGRRSIGALRRALLTSIGDDAPTPTPVGTPADDRLVAGRAMTRFHRPDCLLVTGKPVRALSLETHEKRGRRPCDVCRPAEPVEPA